MTTATFTGNLFADPQLKYTQDGKPYALGRLAWTERVKKQGQWVDSPTMSVSFTLFGREAEHLTNTAKKGTRITVTGRISPDEWQSQHGTVQSINMLADSAAIDLKFQVAQVSKAQASQQPNQQMNQQQAQNNIGQAFQGAQPQPDPFDTPQQGAFPTNNDDEPSF